MQNVITLKDFKNILEEINGQIYAWKTASQMRQYFWPEGVQENRTG